MERLLSKVGAVMVGLVTCGLTLGLLLGIRRLLGFELFSFMWGMIPIGAFGIGLLMAWGYYQGALKVGTRPTAATALGILIMAALLQISLYYTQYASLLTADGQPVKELISFPRFVGGSLSDMRVRVLLPNHRLGTSAGDELNVGAVGYVVATFQLLALTAGSLLALVLLVGRTYCYECRRFMLKTSSFQLLFAGDMTAVADWRKIEPLSRGYFDGLRALPRGDEAAIELTLLRCPRCRREGLHERPMLADQGTLAYEAGAQRMVWASTGVSIESEFARLPR